MAYTKIPSSIDKSMDLKDCKIYGFVTFYKIEDSKRLLDMKFVKFDQLKEPVEIKPFKKKSTKLTLENFMKYQEESKEKKNKLKSKMNIDQFKNIGFNPPVKQNSNK